MQNQQVSLADLTADLEWAQIAPDKVIVATEERSWLCHPSLIQDDRFARPMPETSNIATTQKLLDGAIAAAKYTVNSDARPPKLTATRWVWRLAGQYHLCHSTSKLMEQAAKGFASSKDWSLAEWAKEKAKEEAGHDRLALLDIKSLGYDAKMVVEVLVPPAAKALLDYFTRSAQANNPIDCVGYSYTGERLAICREEKYIHQVESLLPLGIQATRCLRLHSGLGGDVEHVEETVETVAKLTSQQRTRVARTCYEAALLRFSPPTNYISDSEIEQILEPLKLNKSL